MKGHLNGGLLLILHPHHESAKAQFFADCAVISAGHCQETQQSYWRPFLPVAIIRPALDTIRFEFELLTHGAQPCPKYPIPCFQSLAETVPRYLWGGNFGEFSTKSAHARVVLILR